MRLADYSREKHLPTTFLSKLGISQRGDAMVIPYRDTNGKVFRERIRNGSDWKWGSGEGIIPYGLNRLPSSGSLVLCEGESDTMTLWHNGIPALGIPGAQTFKPEWVDYLKGLDTLYLAFDNDHAGEQCTARVLEHLKGFPGKVHRVKLPDDVKDVSALYIQDPERFRERLKSLPWEPVSVAATEVITPTSKPATADEWPEARALQRAIPRSEPFPIDSLGPLLSTAESNQLIEYRCLSEVEAKPICWLWPGRIARGKLTLIAGHPGLGKSQLTANLATIVSKGERWPVDSQNCDAGKVIFLSAEDDPEDTIRPRLEAAGADLSRVFVVDTVLEDGSRRGFNLGTDIPRLEWMLNKEKDISLIIIDPITAYCGGTDTHRTSDVRGLLAPLSDLASRHGAAVVAVSHLNKSASTEALMRVTGSLAFVAAARAAWLVAKDPENEERRLFLPVKNNIGNDRTGFAFSIEAIGLEGGIETSRITWEQEAVSDSANEVLGGGKNTEERGALQKAMDFLVEELKGGPLPSKEIQDSAKDYGISSMTLRRAREALEIVNERKGFPSQTYWQLPVMLKKPSHVQQQNMSITEGNEHDCNKSQPSKSPGDCEKPLFHCDNCQTPAGNPGDPGLFPKNGKRLCRACWGAA